VVHIVTAERCFLSSTASSGDFPLCDPKEAIMSHARRQRPKESAARSRSAAARATAGAGWHRSIVERYRGRLISGIVAVVAVAVVAILLLKFGPSNSGKDAAGGAQPAGQGLVAAITGVPAGTTRTSLK